MPNITLEHAKQMLKLYSDNKALILKAGYNIDILAFNETFDRSEIEDILNQDGCVSFRIYYGMANDLNIHAILVGVDADGNDILSADPPVIKEESTRCPPICKQDAGLSN